MKEQHNETVLDQFGRQAAHFAAAPQIRDRQWLDRIVRAAETGPDDTVLDVACGPGLLACAFAGVARHVTGVDLTPEMLEKAREEQRQQQLENITWQLADAEKLPFPDASFSIVSSRFAFHHFLEPLTVLKEMRRVCRPGGRVVVADSAPALDKADAFNGMEKLRDPSHARALPPEEWPELFAAAGLPNPRIEQLALPYELENLLSRSFPREGDADRVRQLFRESLDTDSLGVSARLEAGEIRFSFPVVVVVARSG
jgi:ubiquinone/menaquinone biosynthesis C-methylase UbiE